MGGPGKGKGGRAEAPPGDVAFEKEKIKGKLGKGEILGSWFVKGEPPKGEAAAGYAEVATEAAQEMDSALEKEDIPLGYQKIVRDYFEAITPKKGEEEKKK